MFSITRARRVDRVARALVAACGEAAGTANPISPPQAPTWTSRPSVRSAPLARLRAFHSTPSSAAPRAAAPALAVVSSVPRVASRLRVDPPRWLPTRSYFAGHPQIRNAEGQDMAQVRAGVRLRKALCAVLEHPSVSHRFEGTGVTILEVRMARDFKKAHVRWTVADGGDDDEDARPGEVFDDDDARNRPGVTRGFPGPSSFSRRKRSASAALRREATRLRSMASKMLRSKHTPRLVFVDDDAKSAKERELDAAFARAAEAEAENEAYAAEARAREAERDAREFRDGDGSKPRLGRGPHDAFARSDEDERDVANRVSETDADAKDDRSRDGPFRYAFETRDGLTPYVSDFVDETVDAAPRSDTVAWEAKVRAATRALRDAEEAWLEVGGDPAALDDDAFDADLDELVTELAATRARLETGAEEEEEEGESSDVDDDDEYVEGDEFDDDDDDEEADFDFDKFDEAERRARRKGD